MGKALSDTEKHIFSVEKPFTGSSSSQEEEAKDNVNDMVGTNSSNQDYTSSALSATSTSMMSDEYEEQKNTSGTKGNLQRIP